MINILYIGMADDIISPLLLCPDFDNLFVIDMFDGSCSPDGTFDGQKKSIIDTLTSGYTKEKKSKWFPPTHNPITYSAYTNLGKCIINDDVTEGDKWTLKFKAKDKIRTMIRYEMLAQKGPWPEEIKNLSQIIVIGALEFNDIVRYHVVADENDADAEPDPTRPGVFHKYVPQWTEQLRSNIETRTQLPFTWTQLSYENDKLPTQKLLPNGRGKLCMIHYDDDGLEFIDDGIICVNENSFTFNTHVTHGYEKISKVIIDSIKGDWYTKYSRYAKDN